MSLIGLNLKHLRRKAGYTQEELANRLDVKRSLIGAYEEGRAEPRADLLVRIAKLFHVPLETMISASVDPEYAPPRVPVADLAGKNLRILSISVDAKDTEGIELVPAKAAAGYLNGYADPEYIEELTRFYLPIFPKGTYRAFEISGDSMLPIPSGSIIFAEYVQDWTSIRDNELYVVITGSDGIVFKRVFNRMVKDGSLLMRSDNPDFEDFTIKLEDLIEVWKFRAYLSTQAPAPDAGMIHLSRIVKDLQQSVDDIKRKNT